MIKIPIKQLTLTEFLQLPETKPAQEYINGEIIPKPMPQGKHSKLQWELLTYINTIAKVNQTAHAFPELRCTFGNRSIVPDVAILRWENIPLDEDGEVANVVETAPDWTIEILSPGQNHIKVTSNILHCLNHGCELGWLIDPESKSILIFPSQQQPQVFNLDSGILPSPNFLPELKLNTKQIFDWLKL